MSEAAGTVIRRAIRADADGLGQIASRAWAATYPGIVPEPVLDEWVSSARANWRKALERVEIEPESRVWVADRGGVIIGYATTAPGKDWWLPPPEGAAELTNLYLEPDEIGSGLGSRLYDHAVADVRSRGYTPFLVWAFRDNQRAVRFYERKGLSIDVADHEWILGEVPCKIVRFRIDWPSASDS